PGDRAVVAAIHDKTLTAFRPFAEVVLPEKLVFSGWVNNSLLFNRQAKEREARLRDLKEEFRADVAGGLAHGRASPYTDILSSLGSASWRRTDARRRRVLAPRSAVGDATPAPAFEQSRSRPDCAPPLLTAPDAKQRVADLSGVCVYVTGVSARTAEL